MKHGFLFVLALLLGSWMLFDGFRAFVIGDYVTPKTGKYAGQLGLWSWLFQSIGIPPRSNFVKLLHIFLGFCWISFSVGLVFQSTQQVAKIALCICSMVTLWYLPFGTLISILILILLCFSSK